ncbi:hypothetical protein [Aerococcus christensenii]|uniref:hypothetical protein n=1 Tax=Aerococcus christensenii TaxID=87541 RepID=UPI003F42AA7E
MDFTKQEQALLNILPRGKENARNGTYLSRLLGVERRSFFSLVEGLRRKGCFIGSSRKSPKGYYLVANEEEKNHFLVSYKAQVKREIETLKILERNVEQWN